VRSVTNGSPFAISYAVLERKALVVDDDAGIRLMLKRILSRNNFEVDVARDGGEAIEKMLAEDYDVVLLDLMMPRISGQKVIQHLEENHPEHLDRVIAITAFGRHTLAEICPPVGRCLEKPFDINHLLREVSECAWMAAANG
jgi:CheY-like chemotaxis protein